MSAYSIMLCIGVIAMSVITVMRRKTYGMPVWKAIVFSLALTAVGVLGCKLLYIAENFQTVQTQGITFGGFSFYGAVFLIPICFFALAKPFGLSSLEAIDCCAPGVAIMIALMRVGCFIDGCCGAYPIELFGKIMILPVQLFESIFDFALLTILWRFESKNRAKGILYPIFMLSYSVFRFLLEFFRDTPKDWLMMSHGQWYAIIAIIASGIWLLCWVNRKKVKNGV